MKLSRLSNRQLRRLVAQGEVRFALGEKEKQAAIKKELKDWRDSIVHTAMNVPYVRGLDGNVVTELMAYDKNARQKADVIILQIARIADKIEKLAKF